MALENFTTYTETDPNAHIAVTASRVTWTAIDRNEDAYVYADKGANYFAANFEIQMTYRATGFSGTTGTGRNMCWSLANLVDDWLGIKTANGDLLGILVQITILLAHQLYIYEIDGGTGYTTGASAYTTTANTDYYLTITRDETVGTYGTLYLYIYSNVTRTTLLNTQTLALHTSKKDFRYIYACQSQNTTETPITHSGYTEAMEIVSLTGAPVVTTQPCTAITGATATGNGQISDLGASAVTEHGHCWATAVNPTTADSKTTNGAGSLGNFTSSITGLTQGLLYYVRAYATNGTGTGYGANIQLRAGLPQTQRAVGEIGIKDDEFRFIGEDGVEYKVTGTAV